MTRGIYKLSFNGTNKVYVGQSIDIEKRFTTHLNELKNGTHSHKLQKAYFEYSMPTLNILENVPVLDLDLFEEKYIQQYNSCIDGYNTTGKAAGGVSLGENNGLSKYSNEQIIEAVELMVQFPDISLKIVSDILNISWDTLKQIARGTQYKWVEKVIPDTYKNLMLLKGTRASTGNSAKGKGIVYPLIVSPTGELFNIENCKVFSEQHGLQQSNLIQVLNGNRKTHKGWKLAPK